MNPRPSTDHRRVPLLRAILDLLFPPRCVSCGAGGYWLCDACTDQVVFFEPPWPTLVDELWPLQAVRCAAHLSGPLRKAIHHFKYGGLRDLGAILGQILTDCWDADPLPVQVIVPVPLHPQRERERGYNQSMLLAHELAQHTGLPVAEGVLLRVQSTPPQVGLNASERAANVRNAFRCRTEDLRGKRVLLLDDVLTTGATARSCARALIQGKASAVWGLVLAHD